MVDWHHSVRTVGYIWRDAFPEQPSQSFDVGVARGRVYWTLFHVVPNLNLPEPQARAVQPNPVRSMASARHRLGTNLASTQVAAKRHDV